MGAFFHSSSLTNHYSVQKSDMCSIKHFSHLHFSLSYLEIIWCTVLALNLKHSEHSATKCKDLILQKRWFYIICFYPHVVFRLHDNICRLITTELLNLRKNHNLRYFHSGYNHIKSMSNMKIILTFKNPQHKSHHRPSLNSNSSPLLNNNMKSVDFS